MLVGITAVRVAPILAASSRTFGALGLRTPRNVYEPRGHGRTRNSPRRADHAATGGPEEIPAGEERTTRLRWLAAVVSTALDFAHDGSKQETAQLDSRRNRT
jgi:hypothetical protein